MIPFNCYMNPEETKKLDATKEYLFLKKKIDKNTRYAITKYALYILINSMEIIAKEG